MLGSLHLDPKVGKPDVFYTEVCAEPLISAALTKVRKDRQPRPKPEASPDNVENGGLSVPVVYAAAGGAPSITFKMSAASTSSMRRMSSIASRSMRSRLAETIRSASDPAWPSSISKSSGGACYLSRVTTRE
jgi:hypothetical protein